jgi:hypothetical protein
MLKLAIAVALTAPAMADGFFDPYYSACYQFDGCPVGPD